MYLDTELLSQQGPEYVSSNSTFSSPLRSHHPQDNSTTPVFSFSHYASSLSPRSLSRALRSANSHCPSEAGAPLHLETEEYKNTARAEAEVAAAENETRRLSLSPSISRLSSSSCSSSSSSCSSSSDPATANGNNTSTDSGSGERQEEDDDGRVQEEKGKGEEWNRNPTATPTAIFYDPLSKIHIRDDEEEGKEEEEVQRSENEQFFSSACVSQLQSEREKYERKEDCGGEGRRVNSESPSTTSLGRKGGKEKERSKKEELSNRRSTKKSSVPEASPLFVKQLRNFDLGSSSGSQVSTLPVECALGDLVLAPDLRRGRIGRHIPSRIIGADMWERTVVISYLDEESRLGRYGLAQKEFVPNNTVPISSIRSIRGEATDITIAAQPLYSASPGRGTVRLVDGPVVQQRQQGGGGQKSSHHYLMHRNEDGYRDMGEERGNRILERSSGAEEKGGDENIFQGSNTYIHGAVQVQQQYQKEQQLFSTKLRMLPLTKRFLQDRRVAKSIVGQFAHSIATQCICKVDGKRRRLQASSGHHNVKKESLEREEKEVQLPSWGSRACGKVLACNNSNLPLDFSVAALSHVLSQLDTTRKQLALRVFVVVPPQIEKSTHQQWYYFKNIKETFMAFLSPKFGAPVTKMSYRAQCSAFYRSREWYKQYDETILLRKVMKGGKAKKKEESGALGAEAETSASALMCTFSLVGVTETGAGRNNKNIVQYTFSNPIQHYRLEDSSSSTSLSSSTSSSSSSSSSSPLSAFSINSSRSATSSEVILLENGKETMVYHSNGETEKVSDKGKRRGRKKATAPDVGLEDYEDPIGMNGKRKIIVDVLLVGPEIDVNAVFVPVVEELGSTTLAITIEDQRDCCCSSSSDDGGEQKKKKEEAHKPPTDDWKGKGRKKKNFEKKTVNRHTTTLMPTRNDENHGEEEEGEGEQKQTSYHNKKEYFSFPLSELAECNGVRYHVLPPTITQLQALCALIDLLGGYEHPSIVMHPLSAQKSTALKCCCGCSGSSCKDRGRKKSLSETMVRRLLTYRFDQCAIGDSQLLRALADERSLLPQNPRLLFLSSFYDFLYSFGSAAPAATPVCSKSPQHEHPPPPPPAPQGKAHPPIKLQRVVLFVNDEEDEEEEDEEKEEEEGEGRNNNNNNNNNNHRKKTKTNSNKIENKEKDKPYAPLPVEHLCLLLHKHCVIHPAPNADDKRNTGHGKGGRGERVKTMGGGGRASHNNTTCSPSSSSVGVENVPHFCRATMQQWLDLPSYVFERECDKTGNNCKANANGRGAVNKATGNEEPSKNSEGKPCYNANDRKGLDHSDDPPLSHRVAVLVLEVRGEHKHPDLYHEHEGFVSLLPPDALEAVLLSDWVIGYDASVAWAVQAAEVLRLLSGRKVEEEKLFRQQYQQQQQSSSKVLQLAPSCMCLIDGVVAASGKDVRYQRVWAGLAELQQPTSHHRPIINSSSAFTSTTAGGFLDSLPFRSLTSFSSSFFHLFHFMSPLPSKENLLSTCQNNSHRSTDGNKTTTMAHEATGDFKAGVGGKKKEKSEDEENQGGGNGCVVFDAPYDSLWSPTTNHEAVSAQFNRLAAEKKEDEEGKYGKKKKGKFSPSSQLTYCSLRSKLLFSFCRMPLYVPSDPSSASSSSLFHQQEGCNFCFCNYCSTATNEKNNSTSHRRNSKTEKGKKRERGQDLVPTSSSSTTTTVPAVPAAAAAVQQALLTSAYCWSESTADAEGLCRAFIGRISS